LDEWLISCGGADDTEYVRAVGSLVLIAAVRRVRSPGCKFDELLVLESPQGQNKSTALRMLCPYGDWFSDDLPLGVDAKQTIERTMGKWIVEAAELMNMRKAQSEQLKSFLSRQVDGPVRMAYARQSDEVPRQFVIIGTTNSASYLKDPSGNRRFWPVKVKRFNAELVSELRDQLWAEVSYREAQGESIRLHPKLYYAATVQQEERRTEDPWEPIILGNICNRKAEPKQRIAPSEIWEVLEIPVPQRDERAAERIVTIMQRQGFRRMTVWSDGRAVNGWGRDLVNGIWRPGGWE